MGSRFYADSQRPIRGSDAPKPIRRVEGQTSRALKPVTPAWIPKMAGPRRTAKKASIPKAKTIKRSTHEDF